MRLMLDNGPLGQLAAVFHEHWSWRGGTLHVADMVAWEGRTGHLTQRLLDQCDDEGQRWITPHSLELGSPAQHMYTDRLRARNTNADKNAGEDASIALLAHALHDGVFVTMDAKAALMAVVELGGARVMAPFDCWRWLLANGHIDDAARRELDTRTSKSMGLIGPPPRLG